MSADVAAIGMTLPVVLSFAGGLSACAAGIIGVWYKSRSEAREVRKEQEESLRRELEPIRTAIGTFRSKDQLAADNAATKRETDDIRMTSRTNVCGSMPSMLNARQSTYGASRRKGR